MNRLPSALLLTAVVTALFSQQVFANRPAAEEGHNAANNNTEQTTTEQVTAEQVTSETQQQSPSAVELMMQQESRQTGDVVMLPPKEIQPGETVKIKLLDSPRRGMSMDKVRNELGQPNMVSASVGKPPITHWTYNDRIVYFENSTVLHVVAR